MSIVLSIIQGLTFLILIDAVLSWVQRPGQMPRRLTSQLTGPLYAPVHAVLPPEKTGGMDISPLILIVALQMLAGLLA